MQSVSSTESKWKMCVTIAQIIPQKQAAKKES
jgi:hypothetical protein